MFSVAPRSLLDCFIYIYFPFVFIARLYQKKKGLSIVNFEKNK